MTLALVMGNASEGLKQRFLDIRDDIDIDTYAAAADLITASEARSKFYDRVFITRSLCGEDVWQELKEYRAGYCSRTEFVLVGVKSRYSEEDVRDFSEFIGSAACVGLLIERITVNEIAAFISKDIEGLREAYGVEETLEVAFETLQYAESSHKLPEDSTLKTEITSEPLNAAENGAVVPESYIAEKPEVEGIPVENVCVNIPDGGGDFKKKKEKSKKEPKSKKKWFSKKGAGEETAAETEKNIISVGNAAENADSFEETFDIDGGFYENEASEVPSAVFEDEDDLSGLDIGGLERKYIEQQNKAVLPAVQKPQKEKKKSLFDVTPQVVIVTGDRGSGVTTFAWEFANSAARFGNVLYFDADSDTHGILFNLDLADFYEYSESAQLGVKLCKREELIENCVIAYADNLDILTIRYGCSVTDEELEICQTVVDSAGTKYDLIICDVPFARLNCFADLLQSGTAVLMAEQTRRGFMNVNRLFETDTLTVKQKRNIASGGVLVTRGLGDVLQLKDFIRDMVEFDFNTPDWLKMRTMPYEMITEDFMRKIFYSE